MRPRDDDLAPRDDDLAPRDDDLAPRDDDLAPRDDDLAEVPNSPPLPALSIPETPVRPQPTPFQLELQAALQRHVSCHTSRIVEEREGVSREYGDAF